MDNDIKVILDVGSIQYGQLEVGTTTTGETGTDAKVENVGSSAHAILNFTIPKGDRGPVGPQGKKGENGKDGTIFFNSVSEMKFKTDLADGEVCQTLGFYEVNDGGGATYKIVSEAIADGYFVHELENGLFAQLIIKNNTVNIRQIGARSQNIDGTKYDVAEYINIYISKLDEFVHRFKLYIPAGIWHCSGVTISRYSGFEIIGDEAFNCSRSDGTIITSLNDNQEKILQIGNTENYTENWVLKNITFSSADFIYNEKNNCFTFGTIKTVTGRLLNLLYANFGITDNIFFLYAKGQLFKMTSCWENDFKLLSFRKVSNHEGSLMCFGTADTTLSEGANISACNFEKIMFESMHGNLIELEDNCNLLNCHFGVINTEDYACVIDGEKYTIFDDENIKTFDEENSTHYSIFKLNGKSSLRGCVIDSIEMNNMSYRFHEYNNKTYVYDTIMTILGTGASFGLSINNIAIAGMNKNMRILKQEEGVKPLASSVLKIGNIVNMSSKSFWFDVKGAMNIVCNDNLKVYSEPKSYIGNEFTPMYETIVISPTSPRGLLYYDGNSCNKLNLCVSPFTSANSKVFSNLVIGGSKIILRAKVPNGETFKLTVINPDVTTNYINLDLVGTGKFTNYTFDLSSKLAVGDFANFTVSSSNAGTNCLIDCFKFIN